VQAGPLAVGDRAALARIDGRWVAHPLAVDGLHTPADGIVRGRDRDGLAIEPLQSAPELEANLVVLGCATALGLLAERLNGQGGPGRFVWLPYASTRAVEALSAGHAHVAGVHLVDARTGVANIDAVRRLAKGRDVSLVALARWEVGLVTAAGNPKRLRVVADLGRRGLRIVGREAGSGVHRLLERELRRAGLAAVASRSVAMVAGGHVEVARTIAMGAADVGVATRDVAIAFGLGFVPLAEERFDLVVPRAALGDPRVARLFEMLVSAPYLRELDALGYDTRSAGDRVADLHAA
jgi:molybdate-binding protein